MSDAMTSSNHPAIKPRPLSPREKKRFKILGGNSNPELVKKICQELNVEPVKALVSTFSDGETKVEIEENIRGSQTFIIQSTCPPVNQNLMELLILIDAARRASADKVIAALPYYGYSRQDRKPAPRTPISGRLVADLLVAGGADKLLILDLHAGQIQGFFNNRHPVNHIYIRPLFLKDIKSRFPDLASFVFVSPDGGGVERTLSYAKRLGCPTAQIEKRRPSPNETVIINIVGKENVREHNVIIIDDMVDTAGTLKAGAEALKREGALKIWAYCAHPILSGNAVGHIKESPIEELVVSNSIPLSKEASQCPKIRVLGVERLIAFTMLNVFRDESVSEMFDAAENFL